MASLGLPGMSGFISEFLAFLGLFREQPILGAIGAFGMILTAVYTLVKVLGITYGNAKRDWTGARDLHRVEYVPAVVLTGLIVLIGVYPTILSEPLKSALDTIMLRIGG